ncbi:WD40-repeat-containing domain protein, partial [Lipomyces kononenkoae]
MVLSATDCEVRSRTNSETEDICHEGDNVDLEEKASLLTDFTNRLPSELRTLVFCRLDFRSILICRCVCRRWKDVAEMSAVWRYQFRLRRRWAVKPETPDDIDWRNMFKTHYLLDRRWERGACVHAYNLDGHEESVYCVQFDDEKIITGSRDRSVRVWDTTTGKPLRTLNATMTAALEGDAIGHTGSVLCLQYDDQMMLTGSSDGTVIIWELPAYRPVRQLHDHKEGVLDLSFNDRYIATCSKDGTVIIRDRRKEGFPLLHNVVACNGSVNSVHIRRSFIATAGVDGIVKVWNADSGKLLMSLHGHSRGLACVILSPDARTIVSGGNDNTIRVWDTKKKNCLFEFAGHESLVRTLDVFGRKVLSGSYDQTLKVWDLDYRKIVLDLRKYHGNWIFSAKMDSKRIVSTSFGANPVVLDFTRGLDEDYVRYIL